ncbi:type IX secretion system protein PorQ [Terrimonas alba]|uniref:type IX secretion system protein PorQ n=1 Tax=Terrimonas alba TaxID=3349636 RepID=UPI0035F4851D
MPNRVGLFLGSNHINVSLPDAYLRKTLRFFAFILLCGVSVQLQAQTLGGNSVFNFLRLPNTPQLTALGGVNTSHLSNDVGLAVNNPSLLSPQMHTQMNAVFNSLYDDINSYSLALAYRHEKSKTNFLWALNYLDYGNIQQTDAAGNLMGRFKPTDWVMQVSASRSYLSKWNYGATFKYISSNYGQYRSNGIAADVGVLYHDSSKLFSASLLARNMGTQLRKYDGTDPDELPFDLQVGVSKRLENSPFEFSVTAHHLHRFDLRHDDAVYDADNDLESDSTKKFTMDKLFRHFVFATTIYLGDKVELQAGYNYLRRKELNIGSGGNGLTGFSMGVSLILNKLQVRYARSHYQNNTAYNQFGLSMPLNKYFGLGKLGERIGW